MSFTKLGDLDENDFDVTLEEFKLILADHDNWKITHGIRLDEEEIECRHYPEECPEPEDEDEAEDYDNGRCSREVYREYVFYTTSTYKTEDHPHYMQFVFHWLVTVKNDDYEVEEWINWEKFGWQINDFSILKILDEKGEIDESGNILDFWDDFSYLTEIFPDEFKKMEYRATPGELDTDVFKVGLDD